jgi:hypothetical protein
MLEMELKENAEQLFRASCDNLRWFEENYDRLKRKYDGKWVLIQDRKVVASSRSFKNVITSLKECDRRDAIVEYIQSEQIELIF